MSTLKNNSDLLKALGLRSKEHRLALNLSQQALCDKAGLSISTIKRLESGRGCDLANLIKILRSLNRLSDLDAVFPQITLKPTERYQLEQKKEKAKRQRASKRNSL